MRKKIVVGLLALSVAGSMLAGCGKKEEVAVAVEAAAEESTIAEENTDVESGEQQPDYVTGDEKEEGEDTEETVNVKEQLAAEEFNETQAFNKVVQMFNAKLDLFNYGSVNVDLNFLVASETFAERGYSDSVTGSDGSALTTADGLAINDSIFTATSAMQSYFYNYVNVSPEYYSLEDYVKTHTQAEIWDAARCEENGSMGYMSNALGLLEYLYNNAENLYHGELLVGDACTVDVTSYPEPAYYQLPLLVNDEYIGLDAVYDEDGNLMTISSTEDADNNDAYWLNCINEINAYINGGQ